MIDPFLSGLLSGGAVRIVARLASSAPSRDTMFSSLPTTAQRAAAARRLIQVTTAVSAIGLYFTVRVMSLSTSGQLQFDETDRVVFGAVLGWTFGEGSAK